MTAGLLGANILFGLCGRILLRGFSLISARQHQPTGFFFFCLFKQGKDYKMLNSICSICHFSDISVILQVVMRLLHRLKGELMGYEAGVTQSRGSLRHVSAECHFLFSNLLITTILSPVDFCSSFAVFPLNGPFQSRESAACCCAPLCSGKYCFLSRRSPDNTVLCCVALRQTPFICAIKSDPLPSCTNPPPRLIFTHLLIRSFPSYSDS